MIQLLGALAGSVISNAVSGASQQAASMNPLGDIVSSALSLANPGGMLPSIGGSVLTQLAEKLGALF